MVYVKETFPDDQSVVIWIDGILDGESIPILKNVCEAHGKSKRRVLLNLEGLVHISREGKDFLEEVRGKGVQMEPDNVWGLGSMISKQNG
jgi:hypothetical protein